MNHHSFCSIPIPTTVFAGPRTREEFDALAVEATVHDWRPCSTTTLLRHDGQQWERRCTSKLIEAGNIRVVIQWFDERPATEAAAQIEAAA